MMFSDWFDADLGVVHVVWDSEGQTLGAKSGA